jgi:glycosyltransferase involved in cell wall biosynthesis
MLSVINQTLLPYEIILVDDNEKKEFYDIEIFKIILKLMKLKNIKFSYYHGESKGQVYAQQIALDNCETDWLYKIDDDNILEYNVLELLSNSVNEKTGAISGLIFCCEQDKNRLSEETIIFNDLSNIFSHFNIQFCGGQDKSIKKCEHLYSNYLFNTKLIKTYSLEFSPAGHREDTVFTHSIFRKGYELLVNPMAITYHVNNKTGGNNIYMFDSIVKNEELFITKLEEWNYIPEKILIIRENNKIFSKNINNNNINLIYSY